MVAHSNLTILFRWNFVCIYFLALFLKIKQRDNPRLKFYCLIQPYFQIFFITYELLIRKQVLRIDWQKNFQGVRVRIQFLQGQGQGLQQGQGQRQKSWQGQGQGWGYFQFLVHFIIFYYDRFLVYEYTLLILRTYLGASDNMQVKILGQLFI
eukprot:TRINITY_DN77842_c0_g1_i2.p3 TRINITY_DN77842_c0_g1~~TRINITY_DN77842_c0_g1_i2.p3  ORF type:complete len:152 (+),score=4.48 TRINITY_DN77842_c0_g1_i2:441-896(+)